MEIIDELPPMTLKGYFRDFIVGLLLWVPFAIVAFVVPVIGWILIPLVPFFPFLYPFIKRQTEKKKLQKLRREAIEKALLKKLTK